MAVDGPCPSRVLRSRLKTMNCNGKQIIRIVILLSRFAGVFLSLRLLPSSSSAHPSILHHLFAPAPSPHSTDSGAEVAERGLGGSTPVAPRLRLGLRL